MGIDTPESRTRDLVEKKFGKLFLHVSKKHLKHLLEQGERTSLISHDKGKFGRILGEIYIHFNEGHPVYETEVNVNQQMIDDHHAVDYGGGNKEEIHEQHMKNREVLIEKGVVEL